MYDDGVMRRARMVCVAILGAWVLLSAAPARAEVTGEQQAMLILRILSFEKNLKKRSGDNVGVIVLFRSGNKTSEAVRNALVSALEAQAKKQKVSGLQVKVTALPWSDKGSFESKTTSMKTAVVYVCPGLEGSVNHISGVTRKKSILTFTSVETLVKSGLSVGLVVRDAKPAIMVNLAASKAEGADLDPALLKVSEVLK
jgi:hypothetical protein